MSLLLLFYGVPEEVGAPPSGAVTGQPTMVRGQFVPTLTGYADRIGKYNFELIDEVAKIFLEWRWNYGRLARAKEC